MGYKAFFQRFKTFFWQFTLFFPLAFLVFLTDRITKIFVIKHWPYQINQGIAFSVPIPNNVMLILTPVLLILILWQINRIAWHKHSARSTLFLYLIGGFFLGGAAGNYIDRIIFKGVIDFIDLGFFPSFNLADASITLAAFALIYYYAKIKADNSNSNNSKNQ